MRCSSEFNRFTRGVGAAARNDGHAPSGLFNRHPNQGDVLVHIHRWRLTSRAHRNDRLGAALDLPVDQTPVSVQVERAVLVHRTHDGDHATEDVKRIISHSKRSKLEH